MKLKRGKLVHGVGVNDVDYLTHPKVDGVKVCCPYYEVWQNMLARCYTKAYQNRRSTYQGCTVCDDWKSLKTFKAWMEKQHWQDKQLDKDLLIDGNKVYSPETCVFIDRKLNLFLSSRGASRGKYPLGVCIQEYNGTFYARCGNPFNGKLERVFVSECPLEAHKAWQAKKHEHACALADLQTDPRVAQALCERYAPDKDWSNR